MNKKKLVLSVAVIFIAVAVLFLIGRQTKTGNTSGDHNALAYESHALHEPFNLIGKDYSNGTWTYHYQYGGSVTEAAAELKLQLSGGGYQSQAGNPDTATAVNRDLITSGISVNAVVSTTANGHTGVIVTVKGIGK